MSDATLDFGDDDAEFDFTDSDTIVRAAKNRICGPDSIHVNAEEWPGGDHGHTDCWIIGGLLAEIERLTAELAGQDRLINEARVWGIEQRTARWLADNSDPDMRLSDFEANNPAPWEVES